MTKSNKKWLILLIATVLAFVVVFACACTDTTVDEPDGGEQGEQNNGGDEVSDVNYSVSLQRSSGHPISGVTVLVKNGADIKSFGTTDANGKFSFTLPSATYTVELSSVPEGFVAESSYTLSENTPDTVIKLPAKVISSPASSNLSYEIGSVMHDFSFTDTTGKANSLSNILRTKKAVLLNFWFVTCDYCVREFPDLKNVYLKYADDVEVIGINPLNSSADCETFRKNTSSAYDWDELPFIMVGSENSCAGQLVANFAIGGYPTSILIDREGVVCFSASGAGSEDDFETLFSYYTQEPYVQKIYFPGENVKEIPNVPLPDNEDIKKALNVTESGFDFNYYFENDMYNWPWIISEDGKSLYSSNAGHNSSYAIMYTDVTATEEQCIAFDFKVSTEQNADIFYVFVDGVIMHSYSGISDWQTCYAYVPAKEGKHQIALVYWKDEGRKVGEDTVYIKDMRFVPTSEIAERTEILYTCAGGEVKDGRYTEYAETIFNDKDGYYHVGTENGPLVLVNMIQSTQWNSEAVISYAGNGKLSAEVSQSISRFGGYANASRKHGYIAVTKKLQECLDAVAKAFDDNYSENTWLEMCSYYKVYGAEEELADPTLGFADYNSFGAELSNDIANPTKNHVNKNVILMPRGLWYKFVPEESAIYNVRSVGDVATYVWIADDKGVIFDESGENDSGDLFDGNFSLTTFLKGGNVYYYLLDFQDPVFMGEFDFVISKLAVSGKVWQDACGGYTSELDENGNMNGNIYLADAVDYVLGEDGNYHVKNADGSVGETLYINLCEASNLFPDMSISQMLSVECYYCKSCGSKYHTSVIGFLEEESHLCWVCGEKRGSCFEKRKSFELPAGVYADAETGAILMLRFEYSDGNVAHVPMYKLNFIGDATPDDITEEGKYLEYLEMYGIKFVDYTEQMREFVEKSHNEEYYPTEVDVLGKGPFDGYVPASKELVDILQMFILFGDYSFNTVDNAWLMLASYYLQLGE